MLVLKGETEGLPQLMFCVLGISLFR